MKGPKAHNVISSENLRTGLSSVELKKAILDHLH